MTVSPAVESLPMPGAYFRLFLRRFGTTDALRQQILRGTGRNAVQEMAADPDQEVALGQQIRQMRNLANMLEPGWGLIAGRGLEGTAHGVLGVAVTSAPTLGDALGVLERFAQVRAPYFLLHSNANSGMHELHVEPQLPLELSIWIPIVETLMMSMQGLVASALGQPMGRGRFELDYAEPSHAAMYRDFFDASVVFDRPTCALAVPRDWLPLPCPFADAGLHQTSIHRLEADAQRLTGSEFVVAQVERILEGAGDSGLPLDQVAFRMHASTRTLVRRLTERGTSFRAVLERHRKRRAVHLLHDDALTVAEIADRLGYKDASNFGRACRRWFGTSPRNYRAQLRAD